MIDLHQDPQATGQISIKVIGVGGAGGNAVNAMIRGGLAGVEFIAINTDAQVLGRSLSPRRFQVGDQVTRGLGAGADPELGREAAMEDEQALAELVAGADMVFITAGMGGGTGTGASPVIARICREQGALTVAVVTRPFRFEARRRARQAEEGIAKLTTCVDSIITIPNERLVSMASEKTTLLDSFRAADEVLHQAVRGVSELVRSAGHVNVDFADLCTVMSGQGVALMGLGAAEGPNCVVEAVDRAISSPLLDGVSVAGATNLLINITGHPDMTTYGINEASSLVYEQVHEDANVFWGMVFDESLTEEEARVTVIATGLQEQVVQAALQQRPRARSRVAVAGGTARSAPRPAPQGPEPGLSTYDIPTFYRGR